MVDAEYGVERWLDDKGKAISPARVEKMKDLYTAVDEEMLKRALKAKEASESNRYKKKHTIMTNSLIQHLHSNPDGTNALEHCDRVTSVCSQILRDEASYQCLCFKMAAILQVPVFMLTCLQTQLY